MQPPIYFNRFTRDGPLMRLEGRTDKDNKLVGAKSIAVSDDEVKQLCDAGFPIAVVDASQTAKSIKIGSRERVSRGDLATSQASDSSNTGSRQSLPLDALNTIVIQHATEERQKTIVEPRPELPSGFTITRFWNLWRSWETYGNFWVPAALPYGHTYQVVDFTVTPSSNYQNSGDYSHLAVSALTVSNSNLNNDFDGKGMTLWATSSRCNSSWQRAALQSWAIQGYSEPPNACANPAICSNPVYDGITNSPNTCGPWDATSTQRFLLGANIWQNSVYWLCDVGLCPAWTSPTVDSSTPYFRSGGAGVAFLHTRSQDVSWTLSFQNVTSYTNP